MNYLIDFVCEIIDELDDTFDKSNAISKLFEQYRLNHVCDNTEAFG